MHEGQKVRFAAVSGKDVITGRVRGVFLEGARVLIDDQEGHTWIFGREAEAWVRLGARTREEYRLDTVED